MELVSAGIVKSRRHGTLHRGFHIKADLVGHARIQIHVLHQGLPPVCRIRFNLKYRAILVPVNICIVGKRLPAFLFLFKITVFQQVSGYFLHRFPVFRVGSRLGCSSGFCGSSTRFRCAAARLSCLAGCFHAEFRNLDNMRLCRIGFIVNISKVKHVRIGGKILRSGISIAYLGLLSRHNSGFANIQSWIVKTVLHYSVHRGFHLKGNIIGLPVLQVNSRCIL